MVKTFTSFLVILFFSSLLHAQIEAPPQILNECSQISENALPAFADEDFHFPAGSLEDALDKIFDQLCSISTIKGFTAAMHWGNGTIWKRANGLSSAQPQQHPLTTEHLMGMGSITKSFVTATLLLMSEDGLLGLDDTLGQYVTVRNPNIPLNITIRQMLGHRSGISDYLNQNPLTLQDWYADQTKLWEVDTILEKYVLAPNFAPGTDWSYSNTNYLLAGEIIEAITGQPWYQEVRKRILDPLQLNHTFAYPFEMPANQEMSHAWANLSTFGLPATPRHQDLQGNGISMVGFFSLADAAGCLTTTPEDLVKFTHALYSGQLLQPTTLAEMQTNYLSMSLGNLSLYGLGTMSFSWPHQYENLGHSGSIIYMSMAYYFPEVGLSIAIQKNDAGTSSLVDLEGLFDRLFRTYLANAPVTAIRDWNPAEELAIFPNPAQDILYIELASKTPTNGPNQATLLNVSGQTVANFPLTGPVTQFSLAGIPDGFYLLQVGTQIEKVFISK